MQASLNRDDLNLDIIWVAIPEGGNGEHWGQLEWNIKEETEEKYHRETWKCSMTNCHETI